MHPTLDLSELNAKIGRLFMAGIPGTAVDKATETLIREYRLGGVILFSRNIEDPVQLAELCAGLQGRAMKYHGKPLFLAVDQEGGRVSRLKEPFTLFPGNRAIGEDEDPLERARDFATVTAREMSLVGLNMDLAPVVDVRRGEPEKHLAGRLFSDRPEMVGLLGRTVVEELQTRGVMAVAKHFPGLGRTGLDPHHELPFIEADAEEIEQVNLPPFSEAIAAGVSGVMTSHAVYPALDPDTPATLSPAILQGILRDRLKFKGMIITDDLEMGAVRKKWGVPEGAVAAFAAGADILLICENQDLVFQSIELLRQRLLKGDIPLGRLHDSINRIMAAKALYLDPFRRVAMEEVQDYFKA
jgi:beta-N-acetylhexosaminidase